MEKDIRLIEEIKKEYSTMDSLGEYVQALENLLTRYKQLEKENKTLKNFTSYIFNEDVAEFIPTSLVKEKIEELKSKGKIINQTFPDCGEYHYHKEIKVLEELLEENE